MSNLGTVPGVLQYTQFSKYRWVYGFDGALFPLGALVYRVAIAERMGAGQRILAVGGLLGAALLPVATSRVIDLVRAARTSELATDRLRLAMESGKTVGWDWDVESGRDSWFGDLQTMSSTLEHLGLAAAMRACCKELSGQTKADTQFRAEGVPKALPREIALCLFRVLQESLHNAIKHSGVREVGARAIGPRLPRHRADTAQTPWRVSSALLTSCLDKRKPGVNPLTNLE